jgi:hypothetical protein
LGGGAFGVSGDGGGRGASEKYLALKVINKGLLLKKSLDVQS